MAEIKATSDIITKANQNMKVIKIEKIKSPLQVKDPFIMAVHHKDDYPKGNGKMEPINYLPGWLEGQDFNPNVPWRMYHGEKIPGFPYHPHRGFETVTVVLKGFVDHFDSVGSKGRYGQGDVQWMSAGSGALHSEMFPLISQTEDNPLELFQIWLNLSPKGKRTSPNYKMLWNEKIPLIEKEDKNGNKYEIKIVAGKYENIKSPDPLSDSWAFDRKHHVGIWIIRLSSNAEITIPKISATLNRTLYNIEGGEIHIEGKGISKNYCAELSGNDDITIINENKDTLLLLLEGEPINEPVVAYGPFVMNSEKEIEQAINDFRRTEFGGWPWNSPEPVNKVNEGRFASYNNGERVETP